MSNVLSKSILSLSFALVALSATAAAADHATLAQNEREAQTAIVQLSPYGTRTSVVDRPLMVDPTPATLAINEMAARRAIVDPPVSRGSQAVTRSYGG